MFGLAGGSSASRHAVGDRWHLSSIISVRLVALLEARLVRVLPNDQVGAPAPCHRIGPVM